MAETPLLPGEVITIEPGLYFPGKWGMRVEDAEWCRSHTDLAARI